MGREIRKVPKGWEHPKDAKGYYQPMFAESFVAALKEWQKNNELWEKEKHPDQLMYPKDTGTCKQYSQWAGDAPDPLYYNPNKWTKKEACCFQFYEMVTEGTPLSPVFDSLKKLGAWLVNTQGYDEQQVADLCKTGWQPTFTRQQKVDFTSPKKRKGKHRNL